MSVLVTSAGTEVQQGSNGTSLELLFVTRQCSHTV